MSAESAIILLLTEGNEGSEGLLLWQNRIFVTFVIFCLEFLKIGFTEGNKVFLFGFDSIFARFVNFCLDQFCEAPH